MTSRSGRVWSLLDMLKEVDPEGVVGSISLIASEAKRLAIAYDAAPRDDFHPMSWEGPSIQAIAGATETIAASAEALAMLGVGKAALRLRIYLQDASQRQGKLCRAHIRQLYEAMTTLVTGYGDEMDGRKLFVIPADYTRYYAPLEPLFGSAVSDAFPECDDDIGEAGNALALGLPTACVFHLMRAAEGAAAVILRHLGEEPADKHGEVPPFGSLTVSIESKITEMPRGPKKDEWTRLKSFMAAINRGTRTKVAHPGAVYSETKAENLIGLTKAFMQEAEELLRS